MRGLAQVSRTIRMVLLPVVCAGIAVAGCSSKVTMTSGSTISQGSLEQGISDALRKKTGDKPDAVTCPESIKVRVGEDIRCELTRGGARYGVTASITAKKNTTYTYTIQVDDQPTRS
jgi:Domain of unknown function (DUF4333)